MRFGWYGDEGLGEALIQRILTGHKTATSSPAYDPQEADEGDTVKVVDKTGKTRCTIRITKVDTIPWGEIDESVAEALGLTLEEARQAAHFANSRELQGSELVRISYFELLSKEAA
jgi:uncharacterized protein YhfF